MPIRLRGLLWIAAHRSETMPTLPPEGRVTFPVSENMPAMFVASCGYRVINGTAFRLDMLERFAAVARRLAREKVKIMPPEHLSLLGISVEGAVPVLKDLGFKARVDETGLVFGFRRDHARYKHKPAVPEIVVREDSPFAKLRSLIPQ
jgi:ATP-dependent RNA helicase SUPV3L1/SUV3